MKKILKIRIPVTQLEVAFRDFECEDDLPEIILDLERQLNNLKLVSDVRPIGMYPRFHLGGDIDEYKIVGTGDYDNKMWEHDTLDKSKGIRVSSRPCKDSGVSKDAPLQPRPGACISKEFGIKIIEAAISHYEDGLISAMETFNKIADVVLQVTTKNKPGVHLSLSDKRLEELKDIESL